MLCRKGFNTAILGFLCLFIGSPELLPGADWPHWRGPDRNGITSEASGWEKGVWPPQAPLWKGNVGDGASSPIIHQGKLYLIGWNNGNDVVQCLEPGTGKKLWEQSYPNPRFGRLAKGDQGMYRGVTATPEFDTDTGLLFTLSCDGTLNAWDTNKGGAKFWSLNLYDKFGVPRRPQITKRRNTLRDYGYTTSPLVYRDWVIVEVGDRNRGCIKAFDKWSGKLRWESQNKDPAGHTGGLVPMVVYGIPCVAVATSWNLLVVRLDGLNAGRTMAEHEWKTDFSNTIAGVAANGQDLLISSRYNQMAMARINISLRGAKQVWRNRYPTGVCTPVIHKGKIYFANKGIHCVDFETGRLIWEGGKIGDAGSCLITSDERLLVWGNDGDLLLVESAERSPNQCRILSQKLKVFDDMAWPHVVVADQRVFCKTLSGDIACFSLEKTNRETVEQPPSFTNIKPGPWPGNDRDQVIAWQQGRGIGGCVGHAFRTRMEARDRASLGPRGQLRLEAGGFHVKGASDALLAAAKKNHSFSAELFFQTEDLNQRGPARILSYSKDPHHRNFTIGQERDSLTLRLRTPNTGENGSNPEVTLGKIAPGRPVHLIVTYRDGEMIAYLDGKEVMKSSKVKGDFSNWDEGHQLILGDEWSDGSRHWSGQIFGFAIFQRVLNPQEVATRFVSVSR